MQQPPLLPAETLVRVLRLAHFDGLGALIMGGLFALAAAAGRHFPFTALGLLAAGAGAVELHGAALLRQGEVRGLRWLIGSQPFLLLVILIYCGFKLSIDPSEVLPESLQALVAASAAQWNMSVPDYLSLINRLTAAAVAIAAIAFQGGMALYYWRRRRAVRQALASYDEEKA